ncbi:hypothetical protein LUW77_07325 [Streptomyces radiopugnans]|nr:hypothetical protein LUW77_07325 [Streptomyces radiopugnans]
MAAQLEDLRTSAARLDEAMARLTGEQWGATVELRNGVTDLASSLPFRRRIEVELHHVDLGIGYGLEDMPASFTDRELENMARRFAGHPGVEPVEMRVEDGRVLRTGREAGQEERAVTVAARPPRSSAGSPAAPTAPDSPPPGQSCPRCRPSDTLIAARAPSRKEPQNPCRTQEKSRSAVRRTSTS